MFKRMMSLCLVLAMVAGLLPAIAFVSEPQEVVAYQSTGNGLTNNVTYTIGAGTDAEVNVISDWRSTSMNPTQSITPQYVMVHNTGTYVSTATAKNVHNNTNKTSTGACWHYTVDNVSIYQGLKDTRRGWHSATSYSYLPSNLNAIGIETCVNSFPATETFGGEQWSDGTAIMNWWKNQFDQTMKHTAYLCLVLCERWGLDWRTDVVMHWDAWQYDVSSKKGKDCPMQMRATYNEATNQFKAAGYYSNGRDGYLWQIFWSYLEQYAAGATSVGANSNSTTADPLGTYTVTPSDGLNVRTSTDTSSSANIITAMAQGEVFEVTELVSGNWAKIKTKDGVEGYAAALSNGKYIGVDAQAYNITSNSDGIKYSYDADGSLVMTNTLDSQGQVDMFTPFDIGTRTTPYFSLQIVPKSGDGYYFGLTQTGSGYWMMRDCTSSDQLVVADTAPYMTSMETLEINLLDWWKPEGGQRINQVRFYIAPNSAIKLNYCYFAANANTVTDMRYNMHIRSDNVTLLQPDKMAIGDYSKPGSYKYSDGMLKMTADTDAGFDVVFNLNETFDVNSLTRLLVGIDADTAFNITLYVTHANGEGTLSLCSDYCYDFVAEFPADGYIPGPFEGTRGLSLYGYYSYNNIIPADGMSTITKMVVSLKGAGTSYFNSVQIAANDRIMVFSDNVITSDSCNGTTTSKVVLDSEIYTVADGVASAVVPATTVDSFLANVSSSYTVTVYQNDAVLAGDTRLATGCVVKVTSGTDVVSTFEVAVRGDVNGDGLMSTSDARMILLSISENETYTGAKAAAADIDGSGTLSAALVRALLVETLMQAA